MSAIKGSPLGTVRKDCVSTVNIALVDSPRTFHRGKKKGFKVFPKKLDLTAGISSSSRACCTLQILGKLTVINDLAFPHHI